MARSDVLVDADWVEAHLDDPQGRPRRGRRGHRRLRQEPHPGAVRLDWKADLQDQVRRDFVSKEQFEALLSATRHRQRRHRRALRRQQQLVRRLRVLVLQALRPRGRQAARRRPQEVGARQPRARRRTQPSRAATTYTAKEPNNDIRAFRDEVIAAIGEQEPGRRPLAGRVLRQAARAGAPAAGAVAARRPHPDRASTSRGARRPTRTAPSSPTTSCASSTREAGVDLDGKDTIAYCRIGERSAHTWFVLHELLGQPNVKNYDGSWTEYGSLVGVPIEKDV